MNLKTLFIIFVLIYSQITTAHAQKIKCAFLSKEDINKNLRLNFNDFDQDLNGGHRLFCSLNAAKLIDIYHLHHQEELQDWQKRVLYFHSGQTYALSSIENYSIAINRFKKSYNPNDDKSVLNWNDYVDATIAFLEKDKKQLIESQKKIAANPTDGNKINLKSVNAFIKCFNKSYEEAYTKCF